MRDYVLPDYANIRKGYAKSQEESTGQSSESEQVTATNQPTKCVLCATFRGDKEINDN